MKTASYTYRRSFRNWLPDLHRQALTQWLVILLLLWFAAPYWIYPLDPTAALPDAGIWALILLAVLVFLILLLLSSYLFRATLKRLGLQSINTMVLQFNTLTLWQQYVFYWASFALLLLAAIGCLMAIC